MEKRRDDILQRAREIMAQYTDRQIIPDPNDTDQHVAAMHLLAQIRDRLRSEYDCDINVARHQITTVVSERRKKYIVYGEDGYYMDWNK